LTASSEIFEVPEALPRGPHQLTRDEVAQSQRARLMAAMTQLLADKGYAAVTIGELARHAGVSRAAFYEHFDDKEDCLLAAYDRFRVAILESLTGELTEETAYGDFVDRALDGYLGLLEREPMVARAFILEMDAAGPAARELRREAVNGFAALFAERHRTERARNERLRPLPQNAYLAIALGVRELIRYALEDDPAPKLTSLAPDIKAWLDATIQGSDA
jgi:AcrR family transcriptional regulator